MARRLHLLALAAIAYKNSHVDEHEHEHVPAYSVYTDGDTAALDRFLASRDLELSARQEHAVLSFCAGLRDGTGVDSELTPPYVRARFWWDVFRLVDSRDRSAGDLHVTSMQFALEHGCIAGGGVK